MLSSQSSLNGSGEDGLPVQDGVPEHALVAAVEVAVNRIEVESDDVAAAYG